MRKFVKVNGYTFKGSNLFSDLLPFSKSIQKKNLLPQELNLFDNSPHFGRTLLSKDSNRKSPKLFPFVKMAEKKT